MVANAAQVKKIKPLIKDLPLLHTLLGGKGPAEK